jgi:hypothetical protein
MNRLSLFELWRRKKGFDALALSRRLRTETGRLLASMSEPEQIAFLNRNLPRARKTVRRKKLAA